MTRIPCRWRHLARELRELGPGGAAYRAYWEGRQRTGLVARSERRALRRWEATAARFDPGEAWIGRVPFPDAAEAELRLRGVVPRSSASELLDTARRAMRGRVLCFGRWTADYGDPVDWHLLPAAGERWDAELHWSEALRDSALCGDVKLTWEIGRFPHAYHMARAAVSTPGSRDELASALAAQIEGFVRCNPAGLGVHWASGQEIALRLMAWAFAARVLFGMGRSRYSAALRAAARGLLVGAAHVERHIGYARHAVYNNHLLSEALALLLVGHLFEDFHASRRWRRMGRRYLDEGVRRQFYPDGGYIQLSHTYHRVALQDLLWACAVLRVRGEAPPESWRRALSRSVTFLAAHMNPADGRLPNYGNNDGAMPSPLSTCDYTDFRPVLQAASWVGDGVRRFPPGPWDEEAIWFSGGDPPPGGEGQRSMSSASFESTGFHVLRGGDPGTYACFRCGSIRDRFSQIDMLHVDLWWRGENMLVDPGSYLYNGPAAWHEHFLRTASHNTVTVDGHDQMLHHRRFKTLYWTPARLLRWCEGPGYLLCAGEHRGYTRHPGGVVHQRTLLFAPDDLWLVVDRLVGDGDHRSRLQWLAAPLPSVYRPRARRLELDAAAGMFSVTVLDAGGRPQQGSLVAGREDPPRGWLSRYYGEKVPAPSLAVERHGELPHVLVTVACAGRPRVRVDGGRWEVQAAGSGVGFVLQDGSVSAVYAAEGGDP